MSLNFTSVELIIIYGKIYFKGRPFSVVVGISAKTKLFCKKHLAC